MEACGLQQVCAGHRAGCESAAHWMRGKLGGDETEVALLVDSSNAFNTANRGNLVRTVAARVPALGNTARNIYVYGSDLVLADGSCMRSAEGTTQGCPIAMQCFAISTLPLIEKTSTEGVDQEWYADDSAGVGTVKGACGWLNALVKRQGFWLQCERVEDGRTGEAVRCGCFPQGAGGNGS